MICSPCNRALNVRLQSQEYLIIHREYTLDTFLVSLVFHTLLHAQKMLANRIQNCRAIIKPGLGISGSYTVRSGNTKVPWLSTIEELTR